MKIIENCVVEECCNCGVLFGISLNFQQNLEKTQKSFYCPNGHGQSFSKSIADILRDRLDAKQRTINIRDDEIFELNKEIRKLNRPKPKPKKKKAKK